MWKTLKDSNNNNNNITSAWYVFISIKEYKLSKYIILEREIDKKTKRGILKLPPCQQQLKLCIWYSLVLKTYGEYDAYFVFGKM